MGTAFQIPNIGKQRWALHCKIIWCYIYQQTFIVCLLETSSWDISFEILLGSERSPLLKCISEIDQRFSMALAIELLGGWGLEGLLEFRTASVDPVILHAYMAAARCVSVPICLISGNTV